MRGEDHCLDKFKNSFVFIEPYSKQECKTYGEDYRTGRKNKRILQYLEEFTPRYELHKVAETNKRFRWADEIPIKNTQIEHVANGNKVAEEKY